VFCDEDIIKREALIETVPKHTLSPIVQAQKQQNEPELQQTKYKKKA
jgi:hypothetical protein